MTSCAQPAPSAESGSLTGPASHTPVPEASLIHLIAALGEQTAALNRLASSNEAIALSVTQLIEELANGEGDEEEEQGGQTSGYLNARG